MHLDRLALAAGALVVALSARSNGQIADARKGVDQWNQEWIAAMKASDAGKLTSLLTDNAVIVLDDGRRNESSPAKPIDFKQLFENVRVTTMAKHITAFGSSGTIAWVAGTTTATFAIKKTGKEFGGTAQYLAVYERQGNGKYLERYYVETQMPPKNGTP
jgi:ketosteroid isomerase-like protein